ncbi:MAG: hypothetical protein IKE73_01290 [Bacilli bacterium]|nr:hypothetical protein [Bacilli bacterium]
MKLNKDGKIELRKRVEAKLNDIEFNPKKRIKFTDPDRLDELLFDYKRDKKGNVYKVIGFCSHNLCKLDLSKITCEDLSFNNEDTYVYLDDTNMPIDFSLTYEYKKDEQLIVRHTSFKNVDLSKNDLEKLSSSDDAVIEHCDLSNTKISISGEEYIDFNDCDLSNNIFINLDCDSIELDDDNGLKLVEYFGNIIFKECNMSNTGAKITVDIVMDQDVKDRFREYLKEGYLDGCYLNGKEVLTIEERISKAIELESKYKKYKANRINETLDIIDAQLSSDGGRVVSVKKKTLKKDNNKSNNQGANAWINEDIDE